MPAKQIAYSQDARERIRSGVRQLARAVKVTLGPRGRNVGIQKAFGAPTVTKDGVTVAKEVELKDAYDNIGAQMVKEVASKTSDVAGDGTTTATVLAEAIFEEGLKNVAAGASPIGVRNGSMASRSEADKLLAKLAEGRVDLTLYGHIHSYYSFDNAGIPAFISGGGGAIPERFDKIGRHFMVFEADARHGITARDLIKVD